jgi:hypothetical protein
MAEKLPAVRPAVCVQNFQRVQQKGQRADAAIYIRRAIGNAAYVIRIGGKIRKPVYLECTAVCWYAGF